MQKVFILGGTGFIGGHAARAMAAAGMRVCGLARSPDAVAKLRSWGIQPIPGDVDNKAAMRAGIRDADHVVFAVSMGEGETAIVDWMLDQMEGSGKSLIFCSGTGVLGERTFGDWSENSFTEWDEFVPSKALDSRVQLEKRVRSASARGLGRGIVVRPPAVWSNDNPHSLVRSVLHSVTVTGAACYIGAGLNMYSHVHAEDLGEVFRLVVDRGQDGAVYHAVAGEVPNRWIAEMVARVAGVETRSLTPDEAIVIWGKFTTLVVNGVSSRSRSPRTRREFGWTPKHVDMLAAAELSVRRLLQTA